MLRSHQGESSCVTKLENNPILGLWEHLVFVHTSDWEMVGSRFYYVRASLLESPLSEYDHAGTNLLAEKLGFASSLVDLKLHNFLPALHFPDTQRS